MDQIKIRMDNLKFHYIEEEKIICEKSIMFVLFGVHFYDGT